MNLDDWKTIFEGYIDVYKNLPIETLNKLWSDFTSSLLIFKDWLEENNIYPNVQEYIINNLNHIWVSYYSSRGIFYLTKTNIWITWEEFLNVK